MKKEMFKYLIIYLIMSFPIFSFSQKNPSKFDNTHFYGLTMRGIDSIPFSFKNKENQYGLTYGYIFYSLSSGMGDGILNIYGTADLLIGSQSITSSAYIGIEPVVYIFNFSVNAGFSTNYKALTPSFKGTVSIISFSSTSIGFSYSYDLKNLKTYERAERGFSGFHLTINLAFIEDL